MIYLDYNSTAPYSPSVLEFINSSFISDWFNPSASYGPGEELNKQIEEIRESVSSILGCNSRSLVFTSGATESINSVLSVSNLKKFGIKNIISSPLEHKATLDSIKNLEREGFSIHWIKNDSNGVLDLQDILNKSSSLENALFSFLLANNETGTLQPIQEISKIIHDQGHLMHVDGVQGLGKLKINLAELDTDFASFSGHKIGSLKGIGLLYIKNISNFEPLIRGGGQERGYRAGTLNFAGVKSLQLALEDSLNWDTNRIMELRDYLERGILENKCTFINSFSANRICNTSSIGFRGHNSRVLFNNLLDSRIYSSLGSACNSHCPEPSHVMTALGLSFDDALSCMRFSIGNTTSKDEIDIFLSKMREVLTK